LRGRQHMVAPPSECAVSDLI